MVFSGVIPMHHVPRYLLGHGIAPRVKRAIVLEVRCWGEALIVLIVLLVLFVLIVFIVLIVPIVLLAPIALVAPIELILC